jgi:hypothetical protein
MITGAIVTVHSARGTDRKDICAVSTIFDDAHTLAQAHSDALGKRRQLANGLEVGEPAKGVAPQRSHRSVWADSFSGPAGRRTREAPDFATRAK